MERTLPELVNSAREAWRMVLAVTVSVLVGATLYAETRPKQYDATAIVAISPRPAAPNPDLVRIAAPKYASLITAPQTVRQVAAQLRQDPVDLQQRVKPTVVTDTGNITITVRDLRPDRAAAAANALAARVERRSRSDKLVSADVISTADPPKWPSAPSTRLIEASALFVGLMLGIALSALANRFRAGAEPEPTESPMSGPPVPPGRGRYPVVGSLPWSKRLESGSSAVLSDPAIAAAGEALHANIAYELGGQVRGLIVVTSPPGSHGKTLVANLLSTLLARSGTRVLLIGTHREHSLVPRERRNGDEVTTPVQRKEPGDDGARLDWVRNLWALEEGLWILPTWHWPQTSVLRADRLAELLDEAREMFDVVVVDGPSLIGSETARTLAWLADGVLLVVSGVRRGEPMSESRERLLHNLPAPFGGIVLNQRAAGARRREEQVEIPNR